MNFEADRLYNRFCTCAWNGEKRRTTMQNARYLDIRLTKITGTSLLWSRYIFSIKSMSVCTSRPRLQRRRTALAGLIYSISDAQKSKLWKRETVDDLANHGRRCSWFLADWITYAPMCCLLITTWRWHAPNYVTYCSFLCKSETIDTSIISIPHILTEMGLCTCLHHHINGCRAVLKWNLKAILCKRNVKRKTL